MHLNLFCKFMKKLIIIGILISLGLVQQISGQLPATPIQISGYSGVTPYRTDLNQWTGSWQAPQALYDRDIYQDNPDYWYHSDAHEGSTWNNNVSGYGILVVDLNQIRTINTFKVFQMFSDGKITGIRIYKNTDYTGSTAPNASSSGWAEVTSGLTTIGTGTDNTTYISNPTTISVSDFQTRYIMLYTYNNGSYSYNSYIELKGIKAFYYHSGIYSENYMRSGPGSPLPIMLELFKAAYKNGNVELNWITASETNNAYFTICRSTDAIHFEDIVTIAGGGNSNQRLFYSFTDKNALCGISYYRLKQTDYDGCFEYSEIIAVNTGDEKKCIINVYPNPVSDVLSIEIEGNSEAVYFEIINTVGSIVYKSKIFHTIKANLSYLDPGNYLLKFKNGKTYECINLVKE